MSGQDADGQARRPGAVEGIDAAGHSFLGGSSVKHQ